jgi:hypothetical protein
MAGPLVPGSGLLSLATPAWLRGSSPWGQPSAALAAGNDERGRRAALLALTSMTITGTTSNVLAKT